MYNKFIDISGVNFSKMTLGTTSHLSQQRLRRKLRKLGFTIIKRDMIDGIFVLVQGYAFSSAYDGPLDLIISETQFLRFYTNCTTNKALLFFKTIKERGILD